MKPQNKIEEALHAKQISRNALVMVVVAPDPPISDCGDSYLDNLLVVGGYTQVATRALRLAEFTYAGAWKVLEVTELGPCGYVESLPYSYEQH